MVVLSPAVWEQTLGNVMWEQTLGNVKGSAPFPYENPALFSMTIAFVGIWLFSVIDNSARAKLDRAGFDAQFVRCQTGIGASGASAH
jgi:cation/acetate symporter